MKAIRGTIAGSVLGTVRATSSLKFVGRERETPVWGFFIFNARFIGILVSDKDIRAEVVTYMPVSIPMPMPMPILTLTIVMIAFIGNEE